MTNQTTRTNIFDKNPLLKSIFSRLEGLGKSPSQPSKTTGTTRRMDLDTIRRMLSDRSSGLARTGFTRTK